MSPRSSRGSASAAVTGCRRRRCGALPTRCAWSSPPRGVQVLGVYVGYVDTAMAAAVQAPKADASDVVRQVLDGLEADEGEVLADEPSRGVRAHLSEPVQAQLARLVPADA